ncbi:hypothetical protein CMI47_16545 [Candidatus Pacearchaeota archaeon]|jgi:hypothetical protein|nr:hypothetical protein [Candidatus Pacearchaeota archaeon]|tara:strand:- start:6442 stop:6774 length:333 start_codon:yes stop_codon:yes gene_type:complete
MSDVKILSNDNDVLEYSELFNIRGRLETYLKDRVECTFIRQVDTGDGKISVSIINVHTLKSDPGFTCVIFRDKDKSLDKIEKFLKFRAKSCGIKRIEDEGSLYKDIVGIT